MSAPVRIFSRPPFAPSQDIAEDYGRDLYVGRVDPSDPEDCFSFLADIYPDRLLQILAHIDLAIYYAGQMYIEAEMAKQELVTQDN
jgi:hypothetical protein